MLRKIFKAFQYRDFRLMWIGACTSSVGTWMQQLAQSWLVYSISGNPFLLGLDAFLGSIPIFLFSLIGGVFADRVDRRRILLGSQFIQMACALTLALLLYFKVVQIWHILTLSFITGMAQSFGGPAYQALIPSLVEKEDVPNAIALNSIQFNLARVIGPAIGGITFDHLGPVWCFGLNGISFLAVIATLLMVHVGYVPVKSSESVLVSMKEGIHFIRKRTGMTALIVLAFLMTMLGIPLLTFLPVFAKNVLHGDANTFSILLSVSGLGSITGALMVAGMNNIRNRGRLALTVLICLGGGIAGFAMSTDFTVSCILLFLSGACLMAVFANISSLVQLITTNEMRGRVMSVYNVAFRGGMPFGNLVDGKLVAAYSAPPVLAINGILLLLVGLYFLLVQRRVAEL